MFKASLFIFEREYILLDYTIESHQPADEDGLPNSRVVFGKIELSYQSVKSDSEFISAAVSSNETVSGYIRVYRRDGFQKFIDYQFANAYVLKFKELFNSVGEIPMTTEIVIGAGIVKRDTMFFENYWNPNNPYEGSEEVATVIEEDELQIIDCFYTDLEGNEVAEPATGDEVYLVLKTENGVGETTDIDLSNHTKDFIYNGAVLENDIIKDYLINSNEDKIKLTVIAQQEGEKETLQS